MKYRKTALIEAVQYPGPDLDHLKAWLDFCEWFKSGGGVGTFVGERLHIKTLEDGPNGEAKHVADPGDWIIRGIQGEFYAIKPDIFAATYEPVA